MFRSTWVALVVAVFGVLSLAQSTVPACASRCFTDYIDSTGNPNVCDPDADATNDGADGKVCLCDIPSRLSTVACCIMSAPCSPVNKAVARSFVEVGCKGISEPGDFACRESSSVDDSDSESSSSTTEESSTATTQSAPATTSDSSNEPESTGTKSPSTAPAAALTSSQSTSAALPTATSRPTSEYSVPQALGIGIGIPFAVFIAAAVALAAFRCMRRPYTALGAEDTGAVTAVVYGGQRIPVVQSLIPKS